jgi:hypothetical protein
MKNGARLSRSDIQIINDDVVRMRKKIRDMILQHNQIPLPQESDVKRAQRMERQRRAQADYQFILRHLRHRGPQHQEQYRQQFGRDPQQQEQPPQQQYARYHHWAPPTQLRVTQLTPAQKQLSRALGWDKDDIQKTKCTSEYRKAARQLHPDRGGSTQKMKTLNSLYEKMKQKHGWN